LEVFMKRVNVYRSIVAGFLATAAMTALMYMAPLMGVPKMDIATMLGTMFTASPSAAFAIGIVMHFMLGSVLLAVPYFYLIEFKFRDSRWLGGAIWGFLLWGVANFMVMPMMGFVHPLVRAGAMPAPGLLMLQLGILAPIGSLMGHLLYGVVLANSYGHSSSEAACDQC
jgi:uncharacterized membrane protein YagU involved in acid resistance